MEDCAVDSSGRCRVAVVRSGLRSDKERVGSYPPLETGYPVLGTLVPHHPIYWVQVQ